MQGPLLTLCAEGGHSGGPALCIFTRFSQRSYRNPSPLEGKWVKKGQNRDAEKVMGETGRGEIPRVSNMEEGRWREGSETGPEAAGRNKETTHHTDSLLLVFCLFVYLSVVLWYHLSLKIIKAFIWGFVS